MAFKQVFWNELKRFQNEDTGITVIVNKSTHYPYPRYSIRICTEQFIRDKETGDDTDEIRLVPFVNPRVYDQRNGRPVLDDTLDILTFIVKKVGDFIHEDACYEADQISDKMAQQEVRTEARNEARSNINRPVVTVSKVKNS